MKKRVLSIITALALAIVLLPAAAEPAGAAGGGRTVLVRDSNTFNSAIKDLQDGDTIQLTNSFVVTTPTSSNDSLFINKSVTIDGQGHGLSLRYAGVLLGADVTFKDVSLGLASNVRPALIANGHTLILDGVTRDPTSRNINLFCGSQTGRTQGDLAASNQGSHGTIIITGNTNLGPTGRIFAGSISTDGTNNAFTGSATVTIDPSVEGDPIGEIYACGALETPTSENDWFDYENEIDPPFPSPGNFQVRGDVTFNLYQGKVRKVSGDTGVLGNLAQVNYNGTSFLNDDLLLSNIGGLTVNSGNLAPAAGRLDLDMTNRTASLVEVPGGSFFGGNAPLSVAANAVLGLQKLDSTVTVGDLTGGGVLALGAVQKLTVTGAVSGTTTVGVGGIFNGHSQTVPAVGSAYIDAAGSQKDSFVLAAPASRPDIELVYQEGGIWTAEADETVAIVKDFKLASAVVEAEEAGDVSLAFQDVDTAAASPASVFTYIDLILSVDGQTATPVDDGFGDLVPSTGTLWLYAGDNGDGTGEALSIYGLHYGPVPAGTYVISVTVPASNSGTGRAITRTAILTVKAAESGATIPEPVAQIGLVYSGQEQIGVPLNDAYTVISGQYTATGAGDYAVTVKPADGFTWDDGSTDGKTVSWSIAQADNPHPLPSLSAAAPSAYGASDGKLMGTTPEMEYAADEAFTYPTTCTAAETVGLQAGDYYVRMRGSANYKAGPATLVTVPHGPVTVQSIAVSSTGHKTAYQVGDTLDVTGLTLRVTLSDGSVGEVPVSPGMVSGFHSSSAAPSQILTVTYGGKTTTYTISISEGGGSSSNGVLGANGELAWTYDRGLGQVSITGDALSARAPVYVAVYGEGGKMTGVSMIAASGGEAAVGNGFTGVKLIWVDQNAAPKCPCVEIGASK